MKRGRDMGGDRHNDRRNQGRRGHPRKQDAGPHGGGRPRRPKTPAYAPRPGGLEKPGVNSRTDASARRQHGAGVAPRRPAIEPPPLAPSRDLVFGAEPVHELVTAAPDAVRVLYVRDDLAGRFGSDIESVRAAGGTVESVDAARLARMAGAEARHQGVVALIREYNYVAFEDVVAAKPDPLLLVDGVTDPRNLGALLRSAEGAGVSTIVLARDRTVGLTPAAIKASAGAWIHLRLARCGNVVRALEDLKEAGYWVAALAPDGDTDLYALDTTRKLALVMGSEERGIRGIVRKNADFVVRIPMHGRVGSLNVSVAAAVALFEIARHRAATAAASDAPASGSTEPR